MLPLRFVTLDRMLPTGMPLASAAYRLMDKLSKSNAENELSETVRFFMAMYNEGPVLKLEKGETKSAIGESCTLVALRLSMTDTAFAGVMDRAALAKATVKQV